MEGKVEEIQVQNWGPITPHFNLRQTRTNKPTIIYCVYTFAGRQWKITTGVKVLPSQWDSIRQMAIESNQQRQLHNRNNAIVNKVLAKIRQRFTDCVERVEDADKMADVVNVLIQDIYPPKARKRVIKHVGFRYNDKNEIQGTMKRKEPMILKLRRANQWKTDLEGRNPKALTVHIGMFERFVKEAGIEDIESNLTKETFDKFRMWMKSKEYAPKTRINAEKGIRTLCNNINEMESRKSAEMIDTFGWKITKDGRTNEEKQAKRPPLTEDELFALWNLKGLDEKEIQCRDLFIALCCSGQRISDLYKVMIAEADNSLTTEGLRFIHIKQKKGEKKGATAIISITPKLELVRQRYADSVKYYDITPKGEFDEIKDGQKLNKDLRKLARMAGLDRIVKYEDKKGQPCEKHLYELISSHFGRHTYITRMADAGMDDKANKYTSGHSVGQGEFETTYKTKDSVFKAKAIAREYVRKAEVRNTFIFSPVDQSQPIIPTPQTSTISAPPITTATSETSVLLARVEQLAIEKAERERKDRELAQRIVETTKEIASEIVQERKKKSSNCPECP